MSSKYLEYDVQAASGVSGIASHDRWLITKVLFGAIEITLRYPKALAVLSVQARLLVDVGDNLVLKHDILHRLRFVSSQ